MRKSQIGLIAVLAALTLVSAGCSRVGEDWKAAQAADTTEAYQDFLRQHPDSEYGVPAQERVKQLAEDRDWQQASKADTLDAYQQFVATHADGKWAQEARVRIENFQLTASGQAPPAASGAAGAAGAAAASTPAVAAPPRKAHGGPEPAVTVKSPAKSPARPASGTPSLKPAGKHLAQLGAFSSKASAEAAWHKLSSHYAAQLKSLKPHYVAAKAHGKSVVRLQVVLPTSQRAHELCATLKQQSQACMPIG